MVNKIDGILVLGEEEYLIPILEWWRSQGYKVKISSDYKVEEGYNIFLVLGRKNLPWEDIISNLNRFNAKKILLNPWGEKYDIVHSPIWSAIISFVPMEDKRTYKVEVPYYSVLDFSKDMLFEELKLPKDKNIIILLGDFIPFLKNVIINLNEDSSIYLLGLIFSVEEKKKIGEEVKDLIDLRIVESWKDIVKYTFCSKLVVLYQKEDEFPLLFYQVITGYSPVLVRDVGILKYSYWEGLRYTEDNLLDKIRYLLKNGEEREDIVKYYQALSYGHSPERVGSQFLYIFNEVLNPISYPSSSKLRRYVKNPLFKARPNVYIEVNNKKIQWEKLVYNAGAIRLEGKIYIFYRALGEDGFSRIGLWWSKDGYKEEGRLDYPIFGPEEEYEIPKRLEKRKEWQLKNLGMIRELGGTEDPRISLIEDNLYMTYTSYGDLVQLSLARIKVKDFLRGVKEFKSYEEWKSLWERNGPIFKGLDDKDAVLFPVYERVEEKIEGTPFYKGNFINLFPELLNNKIALIHRVPPDMQILFTNEIPYKGPTVGKTFLMPRPGYWDSEKIGAGAPPLKTKFGWLHIYHGVGRWKGKRTYALGVVLTPFDDPTKIIYRSPEPILEPEEYYEIEGWVPDVVFTCGVVPKFKDSTEILEETDEILVYYGGADEVMALAEGKIGDLIPKEIRR